jgi:hypothetical protein
MTRTRTVDAPDTAVGYEVSPQRYVTGLTTDAMCDVTTMPVRGNVTVTVEPGPTKAAHSGGVLSL